VSRQCAPEIFSDKAGQSVVARQPQTREELMAATRALLACPTGSIGATGIALQTEGLFPELIEDGVFYCGYTSRDSFGANSYFVERAAGNLLVDSPRFVPPLVRAFEAKGGLAHVLLTHRDDVADAERYARHFGAEVAIHQDDRDAAPFATRIFLGAAATDLRPGLRAIPVPGHTRGSVVFLLEERFLFTGDSLYWSRRRRRLSAFRDATWYSWDELLTSLQRLADFRFEWVLPGHGNRAKGETDKWRVELGELVERGRAERGSDW
jgi:glyoxylase-like metal-dependent hydrolase (beta-lactamase superfamily II)